MREVHILTEEEHKQIRELQISVEVVRAGAGQQLDQGDVARVFRNFSMGIKRLCDHYEIPPEADYDVDVDRGILTVDE